MARETLVSLRQERDAARQDLARAQSEVPSLRAKIDDLTRQRDLAREALDALAKSDAPLADTLKSLAEEREAHHLAAKSLLAEEEKRADAEQALVSLREDLRAALGLKGASDSAIVEAVNLRLDPEEISQALDLGASPDTDEVRVAIAGLKQEAEHAARDVLAQLAAAAPGHGGRCVVCTGPLTFDGMGHRPSCGYSLERLADVTGVAL